MPKIKVDIEDGDLAFIGARIDSAVAAVDRLRGTFDTLLKMKWTLRICGMKFITFDGEVKPDAEE